jgi:hypothetical protein
MRPPSRGGVRGSGRGKGGREGRDPLEVEEARVLWGPPLQHHLPVGYCYHSGLLLEHVCYLGHPAHLSPGCEAGLPFDVLLLKEAPP